MALLATGRGGRQKKTSTEEDPSVCLDLTTAPSGCEMPKLHVFLFSLFSTLWLSFEDRGGRGGMNDP